MKNKKLKEIINYRTFLPPAVLTILITLIGMIAPKQLGTAMTKMLNISTTYGGWIYILGSFLLVVFCIYICFSKYGKIRLGGKNAVPEISFFKWFSIVLTSGMAAGLCYWSVAEPIGTFLNPPEFSGLTGGSAQAAEMTLRYSFLHWTLHPYAIYTSVGIVLGFMYWNAGKPFSVSSGLYPLIGKKANGKIEHWINAICIFCLIAGLGTTIGLAVDQLSNGLNFIIGKTYNLERVGLIICILFATAAVIAACTGLHKGVALVSSINIYLFIILLIFAFLFGGTLFIINNTISSIGQYFQFFVSQSLYLEPTHQSGWVNKWTIFYLAWWLAFAPLIGLFQIKLAKGRTIKEYIIVNMFVPCLFLVAWFGVFGSSSIHMELNGNTAISQAILKYGNSVAFFAYLKQLPLSSIMLVVAVVAVVFSIITQTEAEILTISDLCIKDEEGKASSDRKSPSIIKIFWGAMMSLLAFALLYSGGLDAVQTASIVLGLPMLILILVICFSGLKGFKNYKKYDKTLEKGEDY